ncbi:MAG TPA: GPW/gp25 family protein, partial [Gemmatimonadaceae bacterium]|nr:GPW/gp25 family protein [Gemmatimonadaceae bacterium]
MKPELYGRGASFPVAVDAAGGVAESAGVRKIEESIQIILGTQHGERVMRPTFGCNLKSLVFAPNNIA